MERGPIAPARRPQVGFRVPALLLMALLVGLPIASHGVEASVAWELPISSAPSLAMAPLPAWLALGTS